MFHATYKKEPHLTVAIKKIHLALKPGQHGEDIENVRKEIQFLRECDHPNVTQFYGAYHKEGTLWIAMEYCGGGSVGDIARQRQFTSKEIAVILREALKGLAYLHSKKKIHRDVKGGNILLTEDGQVKIADFGVSAQLRNTASRRGTFVGTPYWMSPEMIQDSEYDYKADIWSLGITAIELAEQKPPLYDEHPMRVLLRIPRNPPPKLRSPKDWDIEFSTFLAFCLMKDPVKRPTATTCMDHAFIGSVAHIKGVKASGDFVYVDGRHEEVPEIMMEPTLPEDAVTETQPRIAEKIHDIKKNTTQIEEEVREVNVGQSSILSAKNSPRRTLQPPAPVSLNQLFFGGPPTPLVNLGSTNRDKDPDEDVASLSENVLEQLEMHTGRISIIPEDKIIDNILIEPSNKIASSVNKTTETTDKYGFANEEKVVQCIGSPHNVQHAHAMQFNDVDAKFEGVPESKEWSKINRQFGIPLENVPCASPRLSSTKAELKIPAMLTMLKRELVFHHGLETEGIFRVPGNKILVQKSYDKLNLGKFKAEVVHDPHVYADLIKLWLRELPNPLLQPLGVPGMKRLEILELSEELTENEEQFAASEVNDVLSKLKPLDRNVLKWFLELCSEILLKRESNRMSAQGLSIVIAPNLFRWDVADADHVMRNSRTAAKAFETLLNLEFKSFTNNLRDKSIHEANNDAPTRAPSIKVHLDVVPKFKKNYSGYIMLNRAVVSYFGTLLSSIHGYVAADGLSIPQDILHGKFRQYVEVVRECLCEHGNQAEKIWARQLSHLTSKNTVSIPSVLQAKAGRWVKAVVDFTYFEETVQSQLEAAESIAEVTQPICTLLNHYVL